MSSETAVIYKILPTPLWRQAETTGTFTGAPVDHADGFIHFSTAGQVEETAAKHFAGQHDLLLVALDPTVSGDALKWEVSRGGALFPHVYAPLAVKDMLWVKPIPRRADGSHDFSELLA